MPGAGSASSSELDSDKRQTAAGAAFLAKDPPLRRLAASRLHVPPLRVSFESSVWDSGPSPRFKQDCCVTAETRVADLGLKAQGLGRTCCAQAASGQRPRQSCPHTTRDCPSAPATLPSNPCLMLVAQGHHLTATPPAQCRPVDLARTRAPLFWMVWGRDRHELVWTRATPLSKRTHCRRARLCVSLSATRLWQGRPPAPPTPALSAPATVLLDRQMPPLV